MTDLMKAKGTIAHVLIEHRDEIYKNAQSISQFDDLHKAVLSILDDDELAKNAAVDKAKKILTDIYRRKQLSRYLSTLTTYMTGLKA